MLNTHNSKHTHTHTHTVKKLIQSSHQGKRHLFSIMFSFGAIQNYKSTFINIGY